MAALPCLSIGFSNRLLTLFLTLGRSGASFSVNYEGGGPGGDTSGLSMGWALRFLTRFFKASIDYLHTKTFLMTATQGGRDRTEGAQYECKYSPARAASEHTITL